MTEAEKLLKRNEELRDYARGELSRMLEDLQRGFDRIRYQLEQGEAEILDEQALHYATKAAIRLGELNALSREAMMLERMVQRGKILAESEPIESVIGGAK